MPAVVASPYSKPHGVTNVVHDHTSVLATIEAKWNLPAMTYRDANATTVADFLDTSQAARCSSRRCWPPRRRGGGRVPLRHHRSDVARAACPAAEGDPAGRLIVRFLGRHRAGATAIEVELHTSSGQLSHVTVQLLHHGHVAVQHTVGRVGTHARAVVLRPRHRLPAGRYTLRIRQHGRTLVRRGVHLGN